MFLVLIELIYFLSFLSSKWYIECDIENKRFEIKFLLQALGVCEGFGKIERRENSFINIVSILHSLAIKN